MIKILIFCRALSLCFIQLWTTSVAGFERLVPEIVSILPHDSKAFTQGLEIDNGFLYESTGLYGESSLRKIDLNTGRIVQFTKVSPRYFAEGIALVGNHIIQLTWREKTALVYDRETFSLIGTFSYMGEGWGLCYDGTRLMMSNGTSSLSFRDPTTFSLQNEVSVKRMGLLNDIVCVGDWLYANILGKDVIVKINKRTGVVTGTVDLSNLLTSEERRKIGREDVLNGITYFADHQTFFVTGKRWPWIFEVRFVPFKG